MISEAQVSRAAKRNRLSIGIGLCALSWLVFGQTLWHPFINFDDPQYVLDVPEVTGGLTVAGLKWAFTHVHGGNWHPLTTISHMLDCQFYGLWPGGHHLTNVVLHTATVVLLFAVLEQMTGNIWPAAFIAAIFAIHPQRAESVAWIAERKDVLSGLFFVMTLGAYLSYVRKSSSGAYAMICLLLVLGLMSKPMLVTVPVVLLLLDFWPLRRLNQSSSWRLVVEKVPLFLLCAAAGLVTLIAQQNAIVGDQALTLPARLQNAVLSYAIYLWQMVWPMRLGVFYPHAAGRSYAWEWILALGVLIAITAAAIAWRRSRPYLFTGWMWYLVMLLPVIGFIPVGLQGRADRYTYLPEIGILCALTFLVAEITVRWPHGRPAAMIIGSVIVVPLLPITYAQAHYWRSSEALWEHTIAVTDRNDVAHAYLSDLYLRNDRVQPALEQAQTAVSIRPTNVDARNNLALALLRTGNANAAAEQWRQCLQLDPHHQNAEANYAWILATCPEASVRDGRRAVELVQDALNRAATKTPLILRTLAAAYAECGRFNDAIATAEEALSRANRQGNTAIADDLRLNLANYGLGLPLRDPSLGEVEP